MTGETLSIGIVQCALGGSRVENAERVLALVREAAKGGAELVVTPELLEGPYFCREEKDSFFEWARPVEGNVTLARFQAAAKELDVVLPFSFFEKAGNAYYNTLAMVDADGTLLGTYRKSHIPDGPGYEEKFYFRPGDTGFRVFETKAGKIGGAVCWDQWYPECARALALLGADVLVYPTAIGSEPANPALDTRDRWRRAMVGHAVSNVIPVAASNRIGEEDGQLFYGSSFVAGTDGSFLAELGRDETGVRVVTVDLAAIRRERASWGFFRDRRPELYGVLTTADGRQKV
ncbi:MAG TPA: nitrilase-related carbon-nitrogen hydrolase [Thermoanaerobaculia bacterium]|nr:nitrilase-related carbon-nitrogen hydrolase [Thermoanaerobaculia bacterium]HQP87063.1 nitrilase-related carbon-nitrogen hydrolase [Thermoanaerobaculia bacterium]